MFGEFTIPQEVLPIDSITEIRAKKRELEKYIASLITEFEKETNMAVVQVDISSFHYDTGHRFLAGVSVKLEDV
jgi:membrane protease subunit (stomatin/prohibitin family)